MESPLFHYGSLHLFLSDHHARMKEGRAGWTLTTWARELGLRSPAMLSMVMKAKRNPGKELVRAFVRHFGFDTLEATYFEYLVRAQLRQSQGLRDPELEAAIYSLREEAQRTYRFFPKTT